MAEATRKNLDVVGDESVPTAAILRRVANRGKEQEADRALLEERVNVYLRTKMPEISGKNPNVLFVEKDMKLVEEGDNLVLGPITWTAERNYIPSGLQIRKFHPSAQMFWVLIPLNEIDKMLPEAGADFVQAEAIPGQVTGVDLAVEKVGDSAMAAVDSDDALLDGRESVAAGKFLALKAARGEVDRRETELYALIDTWFVQKFGNPEGYGKKWNLGSFRDGGEKRKISIEGENLVVSGISQVQNALDEQGGRMDLVLMCSLRGINYRQNDGLVILIPLKDLDGLIEAR